MISDDLTFRLLNGFQRDFPLETRPFARIGSELGITETSVIERLTDLQERGVVSRVGPVIRPNTVGVSTLVAMSVPEQRLEDVADLVSAHPEVNHNYEREHHLNLWFVVTAPDAKTLARVLSDIMRETGLEVVDLPLERAYHIDLGFELA